MLKLFLALPELVQRKRAEFTDNTSNLNSDLEHRTDSNYICKLCAESFRIGTHNKAIDHFALHIWCDYTEKMHNKGQSVEEHSQYEGLGNFEKIYGLETWLAHHKTFFGDSYAEKSGKIRLKFIKR